MDTAGIDCLEEGIAVTLGVDLGVGGSCGLMAEGEVLDVISWFVGGRTP